MFMGEGNKEKVGHKKKKKWNNIKQKRSQTVMMVCHRQTSDFAQLYAPGSKGRKDNHKK